MIDFKINQNVQRLGKPILAWFRLGCGFLQQDLKEYNVVKLYKPKQEHVIFLY